MDKSDPSSAPASSDADQQQDATPSADEPPPVQDFHLERRIPGEDAPENLDGPESSRTASSPRDSFVPPILDTQLIAAAGPTSSALLDRRMISAGGSLFDASSASSAIDLSSASGEDVGDSRTSLREAPDRTGLLSGLYDSIVGGRPDVVDSSSAEDEDPYAQLQRKTKQAQALSQRAAGLEREVANEELRIGDDFASGFGSLGVDESLEEETLESADSAAKMSDEEFAVGMSVLETKQKLLRMEARGKRKYGFTAIQWSWSSVRGGKDVSCGSSRFIIRDWIGWDWKWVP